MGIPALVEPTAEGKFRATFGPALGLSAEGATADEAVGHLRAQLEGRLAAGAKLVEIEATAEHPLAKFAGMFEDDDLMDEWRKAVEDYRNQSEERDFPW